MRWLLIAVLAGCASDAIPASNDLAPARDLATGSLFCRADTCALDEFCVEECRGPQHCIPTPPRCAPISAAITSCACLDADPCRATQPCFQVNLQERKVRCICE